MRNDFPQRTKQNGCEFRIPDSRSHAFHKPYKNMADSNKLTFTPFSLFFVWKTAIESMQSLGMDNFRVA